MLVLSLLFGVELVVFSVWLDGASLARAAGLAGAIRDWGPVVLRAIVGFAAVFATFIWLKHRAALDRMSSELAEVPIGWTLLGAHFVAIALFAALSSRLYGGAPGTGTSFLAGTWLLAGTSAIAFAALAFIPWVQWMRLVASGGWLWVYALIAILLASSVGTISRSLWQPASRLTFSLAKLFLKPFVTGILADPASLRLGTTHFRTTIAPECSGLEGAGLILAFGTVWLLLFRRECRFPQSLLLIPAGIVILFLLNAVRIAALILIGDAGARQIAIGGFHSQTGWILFNAVAMGFCVSVRRVPWFTTRALDPGSHTQRSYSLAAENPTAAYLLPFLAILAAGMIATAASGGFEWLYPLRLVAAGTTLWIFRKRYAELNWRAGWLAPAIGALVFVIWIALDWAVRVRWQGQGPDAGVPSALIASSDASRMIWIAGRVAAAIVTVPVAEELAFRGFLMRRLMSEDFESISFQRTTWFALLASSVVFGLLHGGQWMSGILAGIVFGLLAKRRGRIGDAVVAHATANVLLAAYILFYGQWHLW
jgi:exosortase E/protease (VPEID-CTERM system)